MTTTAALARCTGDGACPYRWRHGKPRPCPDHDQDDQAIRTAAESLGIELRQLAEMAPGNRGGAPDGGHGDGN